MHTAQVISCVIRCELTRSSKRNCVARRLNMTDWRILACQGMNHLAGVGLAATGKFCMAKDFPNFGYNSKISTH